MATQEGFLVVARVMGAHGIHGEVRCRLVTEFPERFYPGLVLHIEGSNRVLTVVSVGVDVDSVRLGFEEVRSRDESESLRGVELLVPEQDAVRLPPGQYFWHQVIGLSVQLEDGSRIGSVRDILETGANHVYVVDTVNGEALIPVIPDVVLEIDPSSRGVVVRPLPGMLPDAPRSPRRRRRTT